VDTRGCGIVDDGTVDVVTVGRAIVVVVVVSGAASSPPPPLSSPPPPPDGTEVVEVVDGAEVVEVVEVVDGAAATGGVALNRE
jgi:hypothetical protein